MTVRPELRLPLAGWVLTTGLVVALALQVDALIYGAVPYLALNGLTLVLGLTRTPPLSDRAAQVLAWCTAAQLPTMLSLIFDVNGNRNPRKQMERDATAQASSPTRSERPDTAGVGERAHRPPSQRNVG